jgi:hypothetical protein
MIDLYADAEFRDFTFLRKILREEVEKLYVKEKEWKVHTGTQTKPFEKEIYAKRKK